MALYLPSDDNLFFDNEDGFSQPVIFSPGTSNQVVTSAILDIEPFTYIDQNGVIINEQIPILIIKTSNIPSYSNINFVTFTIGNQKGICSSQNDDGTGFTKLYIKWI